MADLTTSCLPKISTWARCRVLRIFQSSSDASQRRNSFNIPQSNIQESDKKLAYLSASNIRQHGEKDNISSIMFRSATDLSGSALFYQSKITNEEAEAKEKKLNPRLAISPASVLLGFATLLYVSGAEMVHTGVPLLGQTRGVNKESIALALTIGGVIDVPCRIGHGFLADRKIISAVTQLSLCMLLTGTAALLCAIISGLPGILIMLITVSSCGMAVFSLLPIVCGEVLGQENVRSGMGINYVYQAFGTIASTVSGGVIYEATKEWENVYFFISAAMILGGSILALLSIYNYCSSMRQGKTTAE